MPTTPLTTRSRRAWLLAAWLPLALACGLAQGAALPLARFVLPEGVSGLQPLLERVIETGRFDEPFAPGDAEDEESALRRVRQTAAEVLRTEGYFDAKLTVEADSDGRARYRIRVEPGTPAKVTAVELSFRGTIESRPQRIEELRRSWEMPVGRRFRDTDWSSAKTRLLQRLRERDYAAARLVDSQARVDPAEGTVALLVELDSGPAFTLGDLQVSGLHRYALALVQRYNSFERGSPFDADRLLEFQRRLQQSGYFGSVVVDVDPDPQHAELAPIRVDVAEAKTRRVSLGPGYSTNVGPRAEATYRQALIFGSPDTLQSGVGYDKTRSVAYSDLYLPPKPNGALDSIGALTEHTDINNVLTRRWAVGVARTLTRTGSPQAESPDLPHADAAAPSASLPAAAPTYDTHFDINLQHENRRYNGAGSPPPSTIDVVSTTLAWTRRTVDHVTDPTRGDILTLSGTYGVRRAPVINLVNASFVRGYTRYLRYVPLGRDDQWIVRGEVGYIIADTLDDVPSEFLFRAGGVGSVRGFPYLVLGEQQGSATLGSRGLLTLSNEFVHWLTPQWGAALFYDAGDAGNHMHLTGLARGFGAGARWRTLAGPLALDLAYGERTPEGLGGRWRVHFAVAIAF
ncbi:MAG TPA: BamA/TamA family outer membrane protein [Burkholderiaceae bacterium]